jgi:DNA-binding NtrC family response regulator
MKAVNLRRRLPETGTPCETIMEDHPDREALARIVGDSPCIRALRETIMRVADTDQREHIIGPTGVGKELVARAIHACSRRAGKPFIGVNCGQLTEELAQALLFGYRRGAFTGAVSDFKGYFEQAEDGTIFLDEAGEIRAGVQTQALRMLETGTFEPLGGGRTIQFRARVLTATHRDLKELCARNEFRDDLRFRLCQRVIRVPALRERMEDVPLLAATFLRELQAPGLTKGAEKMLRRYAWPGNVRELRNVIQDLVIDCGERAILASDVSSHIDVDVDERAWILEMLSDARGNVTHAARQLGISRETLHRKMKTLGIPPGTGRE